MTRGIKLTDSPLDTLLKMAEGNPGALTFMLVLKEHFPEHPYRENLKGANEEPRLSIFGFLLDLDDMNIAGTQIWLGYKYWANFDTESLYLE